MKPAGKRISPIDVLWIALFFALLAGVTVAMFRIRTLTLASESPESQQQWDQWRDAVEEGQASHGPVKRRVPQSAEPPALVLLRDHFAVCLAGSLVLSSVLFGTLVLMIRGAFGTSGNPTKSLSRSPADP